MGNRLSKIYTKTGDKGITAVSDGQRITKSHPRIRTLGSIDHLNGQIGMLRCERLPEGLDQQLSEIQHRLFDIGGELSMPELLSINEAHINELEQLIDKMNEALAPLKDFILPGGSSAAAQCHLARTQCRMSEIECVELSNLKDQQVRPEILAYLNRLSDWLFVTARYILQWQDKPEVLWQNPFSKPNE